MWILAQAELPIDWIGAFMGMAFGLAVGFGFVFVAVGEVNGITGGIFLCIAFGVVGSMALGIAEGMPRIVAMGMDVAAAKMTTFSMAIVFILFFAALLIALVTASLMALLIVGCMSIGMDGGVAVRMARSLAFGTTSCVVLGISAVFVLAMAFDMAGGEAIKMTAEWSEFMIIGVAAVMAAVVAMDATIFRPDALIFSAFYFTFFALPGPMTMCTPLPLPGLNNRLKKCLKEDWTIGVNNLNELLAYSMQFVPVVQALNDALAEQPTERLLKIVDEVANDPYDWDLLRFASVPLVNGLMKMAIDGISLPTRWRLLSEERYPTDLRLNTPARAACAGFWYLHEKQPFQAAQAFAVVQSLPNGEEMHCLSQALHLAQSVRDFHGLADLAEQEAFRQATTRPSKSAVILHPETWQALEHLQHCVLEAHAVQESVSKAARSWALNRAIGEAVAVHKMIATLPKAERDLVEEIAKNWQNYLVSESSDVGNIPINEPVKNPYVAGDPVVGSGFKGRDDILRRLEELWCGTNAPPSVVLCGHRRMGKTSILRNINTHLGSEVRLAYVNLQILGGAAGGVSDLFLAMADEIRAALPELPEPGTNEFDSHPYRAFEQYLSLAQAALGSSRLIIALDEFEQLEEWMRTGQVSRDLLKVLRGYMQKDEHIAFAFAGLHTLEEMTADYFEPFFASVLPIPVSFLSHDATFQVLANPPLEDFPMDYSREALERIWQLTGGQPYLVQLVGHYLVSRFNRLTFELGKQIETEFKLEDVVAVIEDPDFFNQGRYYFAGVWGQAMQGAEGQQEILKFVAAFPDGISFQGIMARFGPNSDKLTSALKELERHDVLREKDGQWQFTVELMRRWVKDFM
ncbi:MAG: AAA family ATPase [Methanothrix sp.]|nr:AAA family ATPase [Methanothrix sp.]